MFKMEYNGGPFGEIQIRLPKYDPNVVHHFEALMEMMVKSQDDAMNAQITRLKEEQAKEEQASPIERETVRGRLPNRIGKEIIDPKTLNVEIGEMTAHTKLRCPNCRQAAVFFASGTPVVRDIVHDDKCFEVEDPHSETFCYEWACAHTLDEVKVVNDKNSTCQCASCGHIDSTAHFVRAFIQPLEYFETEDLCPLCGDELMMNMCQGETMMVCEDENCPFKKEIESESDFLT